MKNDPRFVWRCRSCKECCTIRTYMPEKPHQCVYWRDNFNWVLFEGKRSAEIKKKLGYWVEE